MAGKVQNQLVCELLGQIPRPDVIRRRIAQNLKERQVLRQVLKLSQDQYAVEQQRTQGGESP